MRYLVSEDVDLPEGLARAPGARLEPTRPARARRRTSTPSGGRCSPRPSPSRTASSGSRCRSRRSSRSSMTFNTGSSSSASAASHDGARGAPRLDRPMAVELTATSARADARALPGRDGLRRARRRARLLRGLRRRASRPSCSCRRGRSSTRGTGRCRSPTSRATAAWSRSTGAATAAPTARRARGYASSEFAADALAVMDATGTERAVIVSLSRGAQRALLLAAEHPERVDGAVFIAPARRRCGQPLPR